MSDIGWPVARLCSITLKWGGIAARCDCRSPVEVVIMAKHKSADKKNSKMKVKRYERELHKLQVELCHLQEWVRAKGVKVIIVFEGRDTAGKGGTIKALTERVSPRVFRVVALPAPSERQKLQLYMLPGWEVTMDLKAMADKNNAVPGRVAAVPLDLAIG